MRTVSVSAALLAAFCLGTGPLGAQSGSLRAGAARVEITKFTPPPATPPTGKYEHEKLYLRAIVIDDGVTRAAFINADGSAPASVAPKVAAELNCPLENVMVTSTHSHSAGMGGPAPGARTAGAPPRQQGPSPLEEVALQAVREARSKLQPARMSYGSGTSYLNVNRDAINPQTRLWTQDANLTAPSDKSVPVVKFESPSGEVIALYFSYAMHPVNLYLCGITSADYPGAAARHIEQVYGDKAVAMFSQGASGDQNPLYLRASAAAMLQRGGQEYRGQPLVREQVETEIREGGRPMVALDAKAADAVEKFIEAEGIMLAEEVLRVVNNMPAGTGEVRIAGSQKTVTCAGRVRIDKGPREGQPGAYEDAADVTINVRLLGIGNVGLIGVNGEVYTAIGQGLKAKSPLANTVFLGLASGSAASGYIATDDAYGRYTFQVLGSRLKPGCAERGIQDAGVALLTQYVNGLAAGR